MTVGTTDGKSVWAFRYSSEGKSRSLYYSSDVRALRELYPDRPRLQEVSDETRMVSYRKGRTSCARSDLSILDRVPRGSRTAESEYL